ncbi:MAG TPA: LacI family DNA-binding transcriptional regulator [Anaerolineae bacterium]|nr:LacI family DNA-binding transcriptional regulator [Anaerolineae bacterium]
MTRRVTMADVARQAGVSLMTVSRVLNNKDDVSAETRQHVQATIKQLGYRPSDIARGLVTRRTGVIGVVVPDVSNPYFSEVVRGAEHVAYAKNYSVLLGNTEEDVERELTVLQSLEEKCVDGVMLCSSRLAEDELEEAISRHPAAVLVNRRLEFADERGGVGVVTLDDVAGGQMAIQHLLDRGHRAIGFLAGPPASHSGQGRLEGYHLALAAAGVAPPARWIKRCPPTVDGGRASARDLLSESPELTALFCFNDLVAIGALQTCGELGLPVPDRIAIIGFDDVPLAALVTPALTTCRTSRYELGAQAMQLLLDRIDGCEDECREIVLPTELIVRSSAP